MAGGRFTFNLSLNAESFIKSAQDVGKELERVNKALTNLNDTGNNAEKGTDKAEKGLKGLKGVEVSKELERAIKDINKVSATSAKNIEKISKAYGVFGKTLANYSDSFKNSSASFRTLADGLKNADRAINGINADKIKAFSETLKSLKSVKFPKISDKQVENVNRFADTFANLKEKINDFKNVGQLVSSALNPMLSILKELNPELKEFNKQIANTANNAKDFDKLQAAIEKLERWKEATEKAAKETQDLGEEVETTNKKFGNFSNNLLNLKSILTTVGGMFAVSFSFDSVKNAATAYQDLSTKISLVKEPTEQTTEILEHLFEVSSKSGQPVEAATNAFATLKKSTEGLGLSSKELYKITETLTKAIAIGGSSAEATKNSMVQFSQALSMGYLSGQNFNSVAEQTPGLIDAIARGMGMTTAQLKVYANTQKLKTEEIIQALQRNAEETNKIYSSIPTTVGGALTKLKNQFTKFIGENDKLSEKLAKGIEYLADNFDKLITVAKGALIVFTGFKAIQLYNYLSTASAGAVKLDLDFKKLIASIKGVTVASIANKASLIASTTATGTLSVAVKGLSLAWSAFNAVFKATAVGLILTGIAMSIEYVIKGLAKLYQKWQEFLGRSRGELQELTGTLEEQKQKNDELIQKERERQEKLRAQLDKTLSKINQVNAAQAQMFDGLNFNEASDGLAVITTEASRLKKELETSEKYTAKLVERSKTLKEQLDKQNQPQEVNTDIKIDLPQIPEIAKGSEQVNKYKENIQELKKQVEDLAFQYEHFNATGSTSLSTWDDINLKIKQQQEGFTNLTAAQVEQYKQLAEEIDHLKSTLEAAKIIQENDQAIEKLQLQIELAYEEQSVAEERLAQYERELEYKEILRNLNEEEQAKFMESMQQRQQLEQRLRDLQNSGIVQFKKGLEQAAPSVKDFAQLGVQSFNQVADGIADMVISGKGSLKDLTKTILKNFATMLIRAAIFKGALLLMNTVVPGSGTAVATMINASGGNASGAGKGGGWFGMFNLGGGSGKGFMSGGYTGGSRRDEVRGVVHGQEYVMNANATQKYGADFFESLNRGRIDPDTLKNGNTKGVIINIINNASGVEVQQDVRENGEVDITIQNYVTTQISEAIAANNAKLYN